jgi:O-antigen ligase
MAAYSLLLIVSVDSLRRISTEQVTLLGALTIALVGLTLVSLPLALVRSTATGLFRREPTDGKAQSVPLTLYMFVAWAVLRSITSPARALGVQNTAVYIALLGAIALTARQSSTGTGDMLLGLYRRASWITGTVYGLTVVVFGLGNSEVYGARSFSAVALVAMAAAIPASNAKRGRWLPVLLAALIAASLSRTAIVISALLLTALGIRMRRGRRLAAALVVSGIVTAFSWWLVTASAPIRHRFQDSGDNAVVGGLRLNTSGRQLFWRLTLDDVKPALWLGRGSGTSDALIGQMYPLVAHPHNDYLRILHDLGIVGLSMWMLAYLSLLLGAARRAWRGRNHDGAQVHAAAALALLSIGPLMVTDNVLIYLFVMVPLGTLVGASLAAPVGDIRLVRTSRSVRWRTVRPVPMSTSPRPALPGSTRLNAGSGTCPPSLSAAARTPRPSP